MTARAEPHWEHFDHMADIGVRGIGASVEEAFEQAALAVIAVITAPGRVRAKTPVAIRCRGADHELLLVDWINALVYEMASRHMLFGRFAVRMTGDRLEATAWGEPVDRERHRPVVEVKGATFTALEVAEAAPGLWHAQCVVDV